MVDPAAPTGAGFADPPRLLASLAEERLHAVLVGIPRLLFDGENRLFWVYLLSFVVLGAVAYRRFYRGAPQRTAGVLRFLFPREVYRHPSAILDYKLVVANHFFAPTALLSRLLLGPATVTTVAALTQAMLADRSGASGGARPWSTATLALFVLSTALVEDFTTYLVHALHHRWPLLWEFHKVHHSAEVLTPLTVYRKHPIYNFLSRSANIAIVGPFQGAFAYFFVGPADPITLFGANLVFSLFHLFGANLRHSHVWLPFGPRLSHVLISPAQHQIHHSKAPQHWDKNYGEVFALWDWMFGTLHVPGREREDLEFGVPGESSQEHGTLWRAYAVPFANCARLLRGRGARWLVSRSRSSSHDSAALFAAAVVAPPRNILDIRSSSRLGSDENPSRTHATNFGTGTLAVGPARQRSPAPPA